MLKGILVSSILVFTQLVSATDLPFHPKFGASVYQLMAKQVEFVDRAVIPVQIIMKAKADLSTIQSDLSKEERGQAVYSLLTSVARDSQKDLKDMLNAQKIAHQSFWITNMIVINEASEALLTELAKRDDVARIIGNPTFLRQGLPEVADIGMDPFANRNVAPGVVAVKATEVWSTFGTRGAGITVAGQDTGVDYQHKGLVKQYRGTGSSHDYNWYDAIKIQIGDSKNKCGYSMKAPCDDNNHGTHTVGTMVGEESGEPTVGVAPDAKWMACRNMDAGFGAPSTYIDCFQFFLSPTPIGGDSFTQGKPEMAPHVINNSWGCPASEGCEGSEMVPVLAAMKAAGIYVVVSAGNDGSSCGSINSQPATISDTTLTVGAMDHRNNKMATFSSRGPSRLDQKIGPDLAAPGVNIISTVPGGYASFGFSGTSMAGPHVAGVIALLWSAVPELIGKIDETTEIVTSTATPLKVSQSCGGVSGSAVPNNTSGFGVINAMAAVSKAKQLYSGGN